MQIAPESVVGILGFGVDGRAVAEFLCGREEVERVVVYDDQVASCKLQVASYPTTCNLELVTTEQGALEGLELIFRSPGFPLDHPLVKEAKEKGVPITSSTTEVLTHFPGVTVGITGSNGKTTCTALIEEMLKAEFGEAAVERGGNDGVPRLDLLTKAHSSQLTAHSFLVLELSSFQLIDCPTSPDIAVVLNITPNHLDWHKDMEEYAEAKRKITGQQDNRTTHSTSSGQAGQQQVAVLNQNDPIVKTFAETTPKEVHWFTDDVPADIKVITHPDTIRAAVTAARALKVSEQNIEKVLREFPGVPHRLEFVRELDGAKYYNDSSCTTPESAITACNAFPKGTIALLLGGRDKGMDFTNLYNVIKERDVTVVPYGEMASTFQKKMPTSYKLQATSSFPEAISAARAAGRPNVILSPACASFDMFKNAKERGKEFTRIVNEL